MRIIALRSIPEVMSLGSSMRIEKGTLILVSFAVYPSFANENCYRDVIKFFAINTLFGFGVSLIEKPIIDWKLQLIVLAIALEGSFFGAKISYGIDEKKLKETFGWFVLIVGIAILVERL